MTIASRVLSPGISWRASVESKGVQRVTIHPGPTALPAVVWASHARTHLSLSSKHHPYGRRLVEWADEAGADKAPAAQSPEERVVAVLAGERLCVQCQRTYAEAKMLVTLGDDPWICVKCYVTLMLKGENKDYT